MTQQNESTGVLERDANLQGLRKQHDERKREAEDAFNAAQRAHTVAYRAANDADRRAKKYSVGSRNRRLELALENLDTSVVAAEARFVAVVEHHKKDLCRIGGEVALEPIATMWIAARSLEFHAAVREQLSDIPDVTDEQTRAALQELKDAAAVAHEAERTARDDLTRAGEHLRLIRDGVHATRVEGR